MSMSKEQSADMGLSWSNGLPKTACAEDCKHAGMIHGRTAYNPHKTDSGETRAQRGKVGTMCFRPSAVDHDPGTQQATCPTCGMPVAAEPGTTSGTCPYCGDPIPPDSSDGFGYPDHTHNVRII